MALAWNQKIKTFSFYLGFLSLDINKLLDSSGRGGGGGEGANLTLLYLFHLPYEHLDIDWVIIAESSPLHIATDQTPIGFLSASS